jgi:cell filamentation protein
LIAFAIGCNEFIAERSLFMTEMEQYTIPGTSVLRNKLGITNAPALAQAEADFSTFRLVELQTKPIAGAFTIEHLQRIHHHIFQDLYEFAGELRKIELPERVLRGATTPAEIERSLNKLFDRLSSENKLKGYELEEWTERSATYLGEMSKIQPFLVGNGQVLREFSDELARANGLSLQWDGISRDGMEEDLESLQMSTDSNLRRLILLAMDPDPEKIRPSRGEDGLPNIDRNRDDMELEI